MMHISDEMLFDYSDDPSSVPDREQIERHISVCRECSTKVEAYRGVTEALSDEETWWLSSELTEGIGRRALHDLVARWDAEDAQAKEMIGAYLESPYRFSYANIPRKSRYYTGGVARLLCEAARTERHREPEFSLELADAACLIADALPDEYYPAGAVNNLRGNAWKEYSTSCRYLGDFPNALDALKRAERAYQRLSDCEIQLATVDLCRAAVLWEQKDYPEALDLTRRAASHFVLRRDTMRYIEARELEAIVLHDLGDISSACETYRQTFELAETIGNAEMKARAAKNMAIAYRDLGDIGSASKFFIIALQLFEGLGQHAIVVHTRWSIARLSLLAGNPNDAADRLPRIIADLQQLGMVKHAAEAQLDLAEALVILGRFEQVQTLAVTLIEYYSNAKILSGALTAAAFLKEASRNCTLKPQDIQHVREYLEAVEHAPALPFAPPIE